MKRVGLVVAYDGTNYSGWQIQPNGITIQGVLNDALTDLLGEKIEIMGASRTDAGVHALGNVAVFDTNTRIPGEKISYALNSRLPEDIKNELKIMCVLFTEEVGGILDLEFSEEGELMFKTQADEEDLLYDDIACGMKIKKLQYEKRELLESLEMFYRVFFLGEDA